MDYQSVIRDFAERTRKNLNFIEQSLENGAEVFEVTQLVNSLLGLLVFPQQHYFDHIPQKPLKELRQEGWPDVKVVGDFQQHQNLRELMRYLRNAVSHFNLEFIANQNRQLQVVKVWNINPRKRNRPKTWEAHLSLKDLRIIVDKFTVLILEEIEEDNRTSHGNLRA